MYSDLFPHYKNLTGIERKTKVLKRITSNYYTVEELRKNLMLRNEEQLRQTVNNIQTKFKQNVQKKVVEVSKNINPFENDEIYDNELINYIKSEIFNNYDITISKNNYSYSLIIDKVINKMDMQKIEKYTASDYSVGVSRNLGKGTTKITIWENIGEKKI